MNTCKTCRYWGEAFKGVCDREGYPDRTNSNNRMEVEASADDDSNLQAHLVTGPDFGCTLHETNP